METLIVHPKSKKQLATVEAVSKALEVSFGKAREKAEKSPYSPEFLAKIERSMKQAAEGDYIVFDSSKSLWENIK